MNTVFSTGDSRFIPKKKGESNFTCSFNYSAVKVLECLTMIQDLKKDQYMSQFIFFFFYIYNIRRFLYCVSRATTSELIDFWRK